MKYTIILIAFFLTAEAPGLLAQTSNDQDKELVIEAFELFFNSMRNRDTLAMKMCIAYPHDRWFLQQFSGNDQKLAGNHASTVSGLLKSVSDNNGFVGKCQNEFEDINVKIYQRFAIITADYQCYVRDQLNNKGMYTAHMVKLSDKWKIFSLTRYAEKVE